jgi:hypothetical protein
MQKMVKSNPVKEYMLILAIKKAINRKFIFYLIVVFN